MVNEAETSGGSIYKSAPKVVPTEVTDEGGEDEAAREDEGAVPAVLPPDDFVLAQVAHVRRAGLAAGLDDYPADVGPPEAAVGVVRIEFGVGIPVVSAVATAPPFDRALDGPSASHCQEVSKWPGCII